MNKTEQALSKVLEDIRRSHSLIADGESMQAMDVMDEVIAALRALSQSEAPVEQSCNELIATLQYMLDTCGHLEKEHPGEYDFSNERAVLEQARKTYAADQTPRPRT